MKKIISKIKYNSSVVLPVSVITLLVLIDDKYSIISQSSIDKIEILIDVITALIGVLLTVLTIYLSFPKNDSVKQRMKKTGHNHILLSNIAVGILLLSFSLTAWLFSDQCVIVIYSFVGGLANILITGYYILVLSNYS